MNTESLILKTLALASNEAAIYRGATAPNPAVGAAALDLSGNLLGVAAHQRAGQGHAEARLFEIALRENWVHLIHTLIVTLEPCNHTGKTPACSEAILRHPSIKQVYFAISDCHRLAQGGGERLQSQGLEVINLSQTHAQSAEVELARDLTRPFFHHLKTGKPWVTLKTAWRMAANSNLTMIPEPGKKTFTSEQSLHFAHELRKRADAIITGSGTVLADLPEFTVRRLPDHPELAQFKPRWLGIIDRRGRVPESYLQDRQRVGFRTTISKDINSLLEFLGTQGVLEVLIEAGPTLTQHVLDQNLWDEHFKIISEKPIQDRVQRFLRNEDVYGNHRKTSPS